MSYQNLACVRWIILPDPNDIWELNYKLNRFSIKAERIQQIHQCD
ncbi:hypothetical protein VIBNISOn1_890007 [Vibrio nigripulchritudo SOn1]|uniref:Uncharacterized protein n=1 Tax=Vibrio nigripulchritudo SOn1 TaxID=1238450 RepID=A0AAV2VZD3_9VIBR|nr:hypothetical protein VIBNIENn2_890008 [Vibrio nigripulchritudo ENn2]CCO49738.1 hypothetical protein VIBNISOn1_890007 [Vibrio nigripulchritudo SOn1]